MDNQLPHFELPVNLKLFGCRVWVQTAKTLFNCAIMCATMRIGTPLKISQQGQSSFTWEMKRTYGLLTQCP